MVRLISFRFIRTSLYRRISGIRFVILVILVTLTIAAFVIYSPTEWLVKQIDKLLNRKPELRHFSQNASGPFNSNGTLSHASLSMVTPDITDAMDRGYLTHKAPMAGFGLGNQMFMYASMLGIADHSRMTPVYSKDHHLRQIFKISTGSTEVVVNSLIAEVQPCAFDSNLFSLSDPNQNTTVIGYLQSWKYFSDIDKRIRKEFTFTDKLRAQANEFLENLKSSAAGDLNEFLFIGVHIRRKDMLANYNVVRGYTVASKEYLAAAVNHFRTNFTDSTLVFVVCTESDDIDWSKTNFPMIDRNSFVAFSENRTAAQDMALLASCNHTIITVGTYGWWSGYLAGGQTIYYKDFPNPGTHLASLVKKEDYFPPTWIGL